MFNEMIPDQETSTPEFFSLPDRMALQIMTGMDNNKKHHSKGKKEHQKSKKKTAKKDTFCSQADLYRLSYCLGAMQERNRTLENMLRLALAGQKRALRTDVLETGFEVLGDERS